MLHRVGLIFLALAACIDNVLAYGRYDGIPVWLIIVIVVIKVVILVCICSRCCAKRRTQGQIITQNPAAAQPQVYVVPGQSYLPPPPSHPTSQGYPQNVYTVEMPPVNYPQQKYEPPPPLHDDPPPDYEEATKPGF